MTGRKLGAVRAAGIGVLLSALLLVAACSSGGGSKSTAGSGNASSAKLQTVKIGVQVAAAHFQIELAHELGLDKQNGINLQLVPFSATTDITTSLLTGDVDGGFLAADASGPAALAKGAPITCISLYGTGGDRNALVSSEANIQKASDLIGKKVGAPIGSPAEMMLDRYLEANNIPVSKVDVVNLGYADIPAAASTGQIAAGSFNEPGLSQTLAKDKNAHVLTYGGKYIAAPGCLFMNKSFVSKPAAYGLYLTLQAGMQYIREHGLTPDVLSNMSTFLKVDQSTAKLSYNGIVLDPRITSWLEDQTEQGMEWVKEHGKLGKVPAVSEVFDVSLQTRAYKEHPELFSDLQSYLQKANVPQAQLTSKLVS